MLSPGGVFSAGSSPHTRGAREIFAAHCASYGIIPAYAGSTWEDTPGDAWPGDHPRIRGEHAADRQYLDSYEGSSPHTRGAPRKAWSAFSAPRDHPRIRGEHVFDNPAKDNVPGSSPHTRGARF